MARESNKTWEIYDAEVPFAGAVYGPQRARMAVIGLGGGALLVVSPADTLSDAQWDQLARWGTPRFILAPNRYHTVGITAWKERFPAAAVVAHPRAHARLRKKVPGVAIDDLAPLEAALPQGVRIFSPPMAKQGETWVSVKTRDGAAWFVTDGIVNQERLPGGPVGLFLRLVGFRTRLMVNPFFKRLFLSDKAAFKAWASAEIEKDTPALFVPSHGAPLRGLDLRARLEAAIDEA